MATIFHILKDSQVQISQKKIMPECPLGKTSKMETDWMLGTPKDVPNTVRKDDFFVFSLKKYLIEVLTYKKSTQILRVLRPLSSTQMYI